PSSEKRADSAAGRAHSSARNRCGATRWRSSPSAGRCTVMVLLLPGGALMLACSTPEPAGPAVAFPPPHDRPALASRTIEHTAAPPGDDRADRYLFGHERLVRRPPGGAARLVRRRRRVRDGARRRPAPLRHPG